MSDKPTPNDPKNSTTAGIGKPIYLQVVEATQSGISLSETETDLLGNSKVVYENRGHQEPSKVIADPDNDASHRIDAQHEVPSESHLALRLEKFMQLSARYAKKAPAQVEEPPTETAEPESVAVIEPQIEEQDAIVHETTSATEPQIEEQDAIVHETTSATEPQIEEQDAIGQETTSVTKPQIEEQGTTNDDTDLSDHSRAETAGYKLVKNHDQRNVTVTAQGSVAPHSENTQFRVDQPQTLEERRFHTLPSPQPETPASIEPVEETNEFTTPVSTGVVWEVEAFHWPAVTKELISDRSLAIDRLGNNSLKLMTGVQNRLVVTGTKRGEGVTTIAISLAKWAASLGHRVLLVDGDLERAGLTESVGLDGKISWTKVANKQCQIGESLVLGKESGIYIMPLERIDNRANFPSDIFTELGKVIEPISDCFNLVIVDVGPSRQLTRETNRIDLLGDATVLIHDVSRTLPEAFEKNKSHLLGYGINKLLVAENFTRAQSRENVGS